MKIPKPIPAQPAAAMQRTGIHNGLLVKLLCVAALILWSLSDGTYGKILQGILIDAYLSVAVFVTFTLLLIYGLERLFKFDLAAFNTRHARAQVAVAAGLGVLPGCGGSIMVLTQYVTGKISFGAVVSTLVATMGDAAFLLIAKAPMTALFVISISGVAGIITGMVVDKIHRRDFLKVSVEKQNLRPKIMNIEPLMIEQIFIFLSFLVFIPGVIVGFLLAFQIDIPPDVQKWTGLCGIYIMLVIWGFLRDRNPMVNYAIEVQKVGLIRRGIDETAFIIIWVIAAFFLYEAAMEVFDLRLENLFNTLGWLMPMIGIVIGFIPGCGPQIIVTTLYINGIVPLSVQLGNALSNDGDALFPAIALAPRAAILATVYSGVPAVLISYGYFFLFER